MEIQVHSNQSWFDLSVQLYGTADNAMALAMINNSVFTDEVPAGKVIQVANLKIDKIKLLGLENLPATALTQTQIEGLQPQGIGYMIIENDFTVR
ncbi:hypothetical protein [Flavobacterium columnare]|uniref:hypothetical protein n=1 Tax=Flavobacterium TaxID=237 RepID=UPI000B5B8FF6|nr:hypothetical protein B0A56_00670 [Flavobacterium columnare NBRC 100251 = ATCC 23463]